jgi:hypothetical protein
VKPIHRTYEQAAAGAAMRRELPGLLWNTMQDDGSVLYESDTTPGVAFVVQRDGGVSMPASIARYARQWAAEHPDSDRIYGYVPRTARIVADAVRRLA